MLKAVCDAITHDDNASKMIDDMMFEMLKRKGIGIAAPQIGLMKRIVIADFHDITYVMINPLIVRQSEEKTEMEEGCLSLPGVFVNTIRHDEIDVSFCDHTLVEQHITLNGIHARIIQHEVDHLNGVTLLDRMGKLGRSNAIKNIHRLRKGFNK